MDLAFLDAAQRAAAAAGLAQQTCGDAPATAPAPLNPFPDETFESPGHELFACCECGETRAALVLLEAGADARWVNRNEESCVSAAAGAGAVEIIRALARHGADVDAANIWHMTPAHYAAKHDRPEAIRALFELGASLEGRDLDGYKPIHAACAFGSVGAVKELILLGSSSAVRDNHNWTPVMHALHLDDAAVKKSMVQLIQKEVE
mmetsp:Transcript_30929/g.106355  ORF Transcript_30929/g.106355 Transcript_30929/m.106355 type:complete len:206 (+) Transcript_30929:273-890(+)